MFVIPGGRFLQSVTPQSVHRSGDDGLQSPMMGSQGAEKGQYKFHFNIGSIDSFERKMEEAQEDLGWGTDSFVPITYTNELSWQQVCCWSYPKSSSTCL